MVQGGQAEIDPETLFRANLPETRKPASPVISGIRFAEFAENWKSYNFPSAIILLTRDGYFHKVQIGNNCSYCEQPIRDKALSHG
jgi:hypothetical protein